MRLARQEGSSTQLAWGVRGEGCEDRGQQRGLTISRPQCCSLHASALSTVGQWSMGPVPPPPPPPSRQLSSAARLEAASSSSASVYMMCSVCWCAAVLRHPDDDWHVISVKMFGICKKQPDKFPWGRGHIFKQRLDSKLHFCNPRSRGHSTFNLKHIIRRTRCNIII